MMAKVAAITRITTILVLGCVALWIATGITLDLAFAKSATGLAHAIWPAGTAPKVAAGVNLLGELPIPPTRADQERAILREAVLREPVNAQGLAVLATLDDYRGDSGHARTLFRLSEMASRRNTLAQFWLIEDAVRRGKVEEAVLHYDRAMRISGDATKVLLPILIHASSDPRILKALLPKLAQRPSWWSGYLDQLATDGDNTVVMSSALRVAPPDLNSENGRYLAENLLQRMVALNDGRGAIEAANRLEGHAGATRSLQGGDFEATGNILPFAWRLKDETNIRAYRDNVPTGTLGLRVETGAGVSGLVAQQLIGLAAGHYSLQGIAGNVSGDMTARPAIDLACSDGKRFAHFVLPPSADKGSRFRFVFDVPAVSCEVQSIQLSTAPAVDTSIWLDNLAIVH